MRVEDLDIFQRAHTYTLYMYKITASFPALENYGLTSQIRRAASSINANLMEGSARQTNKEFKQFIYVSRGSANELIYHIMLARDLGYIKPETANKCIEELHGISKMLNGLLKTLN